MKAMMFSQVAAFADSSGEGGGALDYLARHARNWRRPESPKNLSIYKRHRLESRKHLL